MNDPDAFTLREPIPADPYLPAPGPPWWIWAAAALFVLLLVAAIVVAIRRHRKSGASGPDPEQARRNALAALSRIDASAPPARLATEVSLILRRFLAEAFGDPALFETHEEFLSRHDALADLPPGQHDALARIFATLVRLKYSPVPPDTDAAPLIESARGILSSLTLVQPTRRAAPPLTGGGEGKAFRPGLPSRNT